MLSILWWALALLSGRPDEDVFPLSLLAALGGFIPALVGLIVVQATRERARKEAERSAGWTWVVAGLVALYPPAVMALLVWGLI